MDALASFNRSRGVGTLEPPGRAGPFGAGIEPLNTTSGVNIPGGTRPAPGTRHGRLPAVELHEAIRRRAMVRSFSAEPVEPAVVDRILLAALRSPTAGNTGGRPGSSWRAPSRRQTYFDATTDELWRAQHPLATGSAGAGGPARLLLARALRRSLRRSRQGRVGARRGRGGWPVPYWTGDAAFGVMAVLLGAVDAGLGACILGTFRGEDELAPRSGSPRDGACSAPWSWAGPTAATTAPPRSTGPRRRRTHPPRPVADSPLRLAAVSLQRVLRPSCHRAIAQSRSQSRFRYGTTKSPPVGFGHGEPLSPAHDRAGQVQGGRDAVLPGHREVARHLEAGEQVVDPRLERGHHVRRDQGRPRL